jgi:hypothetical protein
VDATAPAPLTGTPGAPDPSERPPLGELLKRDGLVDDARLGEALREGAATGERLGEVVVRRGWATEEEVAKLLAEQWRLSYVDRAAIWFDAEAPARLSRAEAQRLEVLPTRVEDGNVVVAVAEPTEQRLAALRDVIGADTVVVVVPKSALDAGLSSQLLGGGGAASAPAPARAFEAPREPEPEPEPEHVDAHETPEPEATAEPPPAPVPTLRPAPPPERRRVERERHDGEPELEDLLGSLQAAARDAASLQGTVSDLAEKLEGLAAELGAVSERLSQRHELTDRLKTQLADLTRTLDTLE